MAEIVRICEPGLGGDVLVDHLAGLDVPEGALDHDLGSRGHTAQVGDDDIVSDPSPREISPRPRLFGDREGEVPGLFPIAVMPEICGEYDLDGTWLVIVGPGKGEVYLELLIAHGI